MDVTDEDAAAPAAGTHADTCPRCRTPVTVAQYTSTSGPGRLVCCLTCGRVLSVETHAAAAGEPPWSWSSPAPAVSRARTGGRPA